MGQLDVRDFLYLGPEILLTTLALALLLWGAIANVERQGRQCAWLALLSLGATAFYVVVAADDARRARRTCWPATFVLDGFSFVWKILVLVSMIVIVLLSQRFVEDAQYRAGEYYSLLLFAATGMMFMASGTSLLSIWISLELMALSSYILAGYFKRELQVERGGAQVLRARRAVVRDDALRHLAALRRHRHGAARRDRRVDRRRRGRRARWWWWAG